MDTRKLTATFVVLIMVSVAAVPIFQEDSEAVSETSILSEPASAVAMPLAAGFGAGFVVGLVFGYMIWGGGEDPYDPAASQEAVYQQCRDFYAQLMTSNWDTVINLVSTVMPADTTLWAFTSSYWNRATELSVAEWWVSDSQYDPNYMTEESLLRQNLVNYIYDWQTAVDNGYNNYLSKNATELVGDCYGNLNLIIDWGTGSIDPEDGQSVVMDLLQYTETYSAGETIYIDTSTEDRGGHYNSETSGMLYAFNRDVELTYIGNGVGNGSKYTVQNGTSVNVAEEGWPSGLYRIETSNAVLAGPLSKAADSDAADVQGALMFIVDGNQDESVIFTSGGDGSLNARYHGVWMGATYLKLHIQYDGKDHNQRESILMGSGNGVEYNLVRDWNNLIQQINEVIEDAAQSGNILWDIFDSAEESNPYISPSSLTSMLPGVSNSSEAYAIAIQSMLQYAEYWNANQDQIVEATPEVNLESLSVYVYGDVYLNGQLWAEDVLMTPYVTQDAQRLVASNSEDGVANTWSGNGFAMLWAQDIDMRYFDASQYLNSSNYELLDLSDGYVIEIKQIVKDGENVDEIVLEPLMILRYSTGSTDPGEAPEPVKVMDASVLIIIIFLFAALSIFLICYILNQPVIGLILAAIVALVGVVGADWLVNGILYGDWWSLW